MAEQIPDQVPSLNVTHGGLGGLTVTAPPQIETVDGQDDAGAPSQDEVSQDEGHTELPPQPAPEPVSDVVARMFDIHANVGDAMVLVGDIYNQAGQLSEALTGHLRNSVAQPELHGVLSRLQNLLGEFRHAVDQIESSFSEELAGKIADSVQV